MAESLEEMARQIDDCMYIHVRLIEPTELWGLRVVVDEAVERLYPANPERDFAPRLATQLRARMEAQPQPRGRAFEIIFRKCISYTVSNETYGKYPEAPEEFRGKYFRFFSWSYLLEMTKKTSYVSDVHPGPGPLRHFQIPGLDDIVDVVTTVEPTIQTVPPLPAS